MKIRVIPFGNDPIREYELDRKPTRVTMRRYGRGNDTVIYVDDQNRALKMLVWTGTDYKYKNRDRIVKEYGYIMDH